MEISWERVEVGLAQRRALLQPPVPAQFHALGTAGQGAAGEPADRGARVDARHRARVADRPRRGAQPDAGVGDVAGARRHRHGALVPSGDRRDPVRQGGRLRRAGRHPRADRRVDRLHRQAVHRGDRGNFGEAGRGGARDRRAVRVGAVVRRAAAGVLALHRLRHVPARLQPAQLDDGRHRRRRRHRRHAVRGVPALRLRLRVRDPDLDHRADHAGRAAGQAVRAIFIDNATLRDFFRRGGAGSRERHLEDD